MSGKSADSVKEEDIFIGKTIFNKYKLIRKLGEGSFGSIYQAQSKNSNKYYALKLEDMRKNKYVLEEESIFLSYLNFPRIPKLKSYGYSGSYVILVMELLGSSLDKIFDNLPSRKMSIRCVCNIAYQLLLIFEFIHNCDIIHRDIKPANIAIGYEEKSKYIYLLDFGLAKKYRSSKTKKHFNFKQGNKLIGNARYSSINAIEGGTQSRRDDLESLGYVLLYLLLGRLPWQGHLSHSKEDKYYKIKQIKKSTSAEELCQGLPSQFQEYVKYTRNLEYESDPDYNYLKNLFLTVLKQYNWEFDYYYDWDQVGLTGSEIKDKEKDTKKDEMKINLEKVHEIPKLCTKISDLIEERKRSKDIFDQDRFVTDPEEESQFNLSTYPAESTFENNYNNTNSMTPYDYPRKHIKQSGCLPCQPKSYRKEKDDSCCIVF
jgi:serine/threonine protein kinase